MIKQCQTGDVLKAAKLKHELRQTKTKQATEKQTPLKKKLTPEKKPGATTRRRTSGDRRSKRLPVKFSFAAKQRGGPQPSCCGCGEKIAHKEPRIRFTHKAQNHFKWPDTDHFHCKVTRILQMPKARIEEFVNWKMVQPQVLRLKQELENYESEFDTDSD